MTRLEDLLDEEFLTPSAKLATELAREDQQLLAKLIARRIELKISQESLAELIGVSQATVSAFERIGNDPHLSTVRRYARALGVLVRHQLDVKPSLDDTSETLTHFGGSGTTNTETASAAARRLRDDSKHPWPDKAKMPPMDRSLVPA